MANANENPKLEVGFCTDGTTIDIPESLRLLGVTPENPTIHGHVINKLFKMIFENLNHQKKKAISFWEPDEEYEATANNIDICRRNNKIYFCKQTHNDTGDAPKDPATNPDYWGLLLDLDNPIHEALSNYALSNHNHDTVYAKLGGIDTQTFLVKAGINAKSAVNKEQMESALNGVSSTIKLSADGKSIVKNVDGSSIKNQCSAWVNFDGTTTPPTIRDSFNIVDVVRIATGQFEIYFEEPMDNINYVDSVDAGTSATYLANAQNQGHIYDKQSNKCTMDSGYSGTGSYGYSNFAMTNLIILGGKN